VKRCLPDSDAIDSTLRELQWAGETVFDQFVACFEGLEDQRTGKAGLHDFYEMLMIALCAVLCVHSGNPFQSHSIEIAKRLDVHNEAIAARFDLFRSAKGPADAAPGAWLSSGRHRRDHRHAHIADPVAGSTVLSAQTRTKFFWSRSGQRELLEFKYSSVHETETTSPIGVAANLVIRWRFGISTDWVGLVAGPGGQMQCRGDTSVVPGIRRLRDEH
jgi:hypothetical protein